MGKNAKTIEQENAKTIFVNFTKYHKSNPANHFATVITFFPNKPVTKFCITVIAIFTPNLAFDTVIIARLSLS